MATAVYPSPKSSRRSTVVAGLLLGLYCCASLGTYTPWMIHAWLHWQADTHDAHQHGHTHGTEHHHHGAWLEQAISDTPDPGPQETLPDRPWDQQVQAIWIIGYSLDSWAKHESPSGWEGKQASLGFVCSPDPPIPKFS